jgi:hypothetical protein
MVYLTAPLGDLKVEFIRGPRTVTTDFCAPDEKSFGCKYTNSFAQVCYPSWLDVLIVFNSWDLFFYITNSKRP